MNASSNSTPISILIKHIAQCQNGDFIREQIDPVLRPIHDDYYRQINKAYKRVRKHLRKQKGFDALVQYEMLLTAEAFTCENAAFARGMEYAFFLAGMAPKPEGWGED